jgi:signal transduction histidine kinase
LLEPQLRKSNIQVVKNYAPAPPRVFGNGGKASAGLHNLVLNARDAMFDGGTINAGDQRSAMRTRSLSR